MRGGRKRNESENKEGEERRVRVKTKRGGGMRWRGKRNESKNKEGKEE